MTSRTPGIWCLLPLLALLLAVSPAPANPGDIVLTGRRAPIQSVSGVAGKEVILYGPFAPTLALRSAKEAIYLYLDSVQYGGKIATALFYVVDANQKSGNRWPIDERHYIGSFATMEDGRTEPAIVIRSIHDYDVKGVPYLPFTHFRKMRQVMIVAVIEKGDMKFGPLVVSPDPPEKRQASGPATVNSASVAPQK